MITIGLPTNRLVKTKTAQSLLELIAYSKHDYQILVSTRGYNTSENRNYIATQAVNNKSDYLFFVDDDMILPPDTLDRLLAHDKDIVGGIYNTKYEEQKPVIEYLEGTKREDLFKVGAIGTGCMLIKTSVFKKLPQRWFRYEWYDNGMVKYSHDWLFCKDARKHGIDVYADSTLDIKHIGIKKF